MKIGLTFVIQKINKQQNQISSLKMMILKSIKVLVIQNKINYFKHYVKKQILWKLLKIDGNIIKNQAYQNSYQKKKKNYLQEMIKNYKEDLIKFNLINFKKFMILQNQNLNKNMFMIIQ